MALKNMARSTRQRKQVNYRRLLGDASEGSDGERLINISSVNEGYYYNEK